MSSKEPTEGDIIFNRANVALARSQRLIQSWLPPKTAEEQANAKSEAELEREDELLFKPAPELLGVGAAVPDDDSSALTRRKGPASNQRLLEQLLGKKAAKGHIASSKAPDRLNNSQLAAQRSSNSPRGPIPGDSDDEEEEGRASMVTSGNARTKARARAPPAKTKPIAQTLVDLNSVPTQTDPHDPTEGKGVKTAQTQPGSSDEEDLKPTKKRPLSYLDQLLAEKANKKNKKKQKGTG